MGAITLQNRQSLSRRIHSFGGMNGRGNNRRIRFGDISLMRRDVEVALSSPPNGQGGAMQNGALLQSLRWDEKIKRWRLSTNRGDDIRARPMAPHLAARRSP